MLKKEILQDISIFGGSDFVMVFEEKADFNITVNKGGETTGYGSGYEHVMMGQQYGTAKKNN